jgi:hypothetical protein
MDYFKYKTRYTGYSKKKVKSFLDLEVYKRSLELSVFVAKTLVKKIDQRSIQSNSYTKKVEDMLVESMTKTALSIPHLIAESNSRRFGGNTEFEAILDLVMLRCNKMVVYLEQVRDMLNIDLATDEFEENIKKYLFIRRKVLNLQRVWKKYHSEYVKNN